MFNSCPARLRAAIATLVLAFLGSLTSSAQAEPFDAFLAGLWPLAKEAGVSRQTFDAAIAGLTPDYKLPDLDLPGKPKVDNQGQAEFTKTAADYISKPYMDKLAGEGRAFFVKYKGPLTNIEKITGVDPYILVAIWGRETAFGSYKLPYDALRVLATLAYTGRRKDMFRAEFIAALKMLDLGVPRSDMKSSWAGAVGLTQFMPTEYIKYADDGDGDGKADIWRSVPDALASAARQLAGKGWTRGQGWGYEIRVGAGADCSLEGPPDERAISKWTALGFARANGKAFTPSQSNEVAYLMSPAGSYGPQFLVTENFKVIRLYNTSDLYALFVGHLSDRIRGGGDFATPWASFAQPRTRTVHDLQQRLKALGYPMDKLDGKIGSNTRKQIGLYEKANGLPIDCWPSEAVLSHANANTKVRVDAQK